MYILFLGPQHAAVDFVGVANTAAEVEEFKATVEEVARDLNVNVLPVALPSSSFSADKQAVEAEIECLIEQGIL